MRKSLFLLVFLAACVESPVIGTVGKASFSGCESGYYDILDWMTSDSTTTHMEGSHVLGTTVWSDKVWYCKTFNCDTWDINLYDDNYVYAWITEKDWNTPEDFKKATYNTNFPMAPRCVQGGSPGTYSLVSDTSYDTYLSCSWDQTQNLGKAIYEVWGPYNMSLGGDLPSNTPTLVLSYRWGCDSNYANCSTKEAFYYMQAYGWVRWESYSWTGSAWQLDAQTTFNDVVCGSISPNWSC